MTELTWVKTEPIDKAWSPEYETRTPALVLESGDTVQTFLGSLCSSTQEEHVNIRKAIEYINALEDCCSHTTRSCGCTGWNHKCECEFHVMCY